ncbi:MAG: hydrogenase maturation protease [Verrucomicrobia bacterium]|nr:hydrogenase maturation protease [Verrucomicrobiota bacterium]
MGSEIIIGIGNPYRGDDGAGWAVIDLLREKIDPKITLLKQRGDIAQLLDIFATHNCVYLVDATIGLKDRWKRIDIKREPLPEESSQTSTHGFSISQAVSLARNLNQLPACLILYAIKGSQYTMSDHLSPDVVQSVEEVAKAITKEVQHA